MSGVNKRLQIYETAVIIGAQELSAGSEVVDKFRVISGSRALLTLYIKELDASASVQWNVKNSFSPDIPYDTIETRTETVVGHHKIVVSDFHNEFLVNLKAIGGRAVIILAVSIYDNALQTRIDIENAKVDVDLTHWVDSHGQYDSVRIGNGTTELHINEDGSIPVVPTKPSHIVGKSVFNERILIPSGSETEIVRYVVPAGKKFILQRVVFEGGNIADYIFYGNTEIIDKKSTWWSGGLGGKMEFTGSAYDAIEYPQGTVLSLKATHARPYAADFSGRIQGLEVNML